MTSTLFGEKLIKARKAAGVSQAELARRIGVSDTYISAIETGRKAAPPHAHVQAIAACLGLEEESLWQLALADREQRLRDRLDGVPTASRSQPLASLLEKKSQVDESQSASGLTDTARIARRIEELLPARQDREQFIGSLEVLIKILREAE